MIPSQSVSELKALLEKATAIAALSDYPDSHTYRHACLLGDEYTLTFGDVRAIARALASQERLRAALEPFAKDADNFRWPVWEPDDRPINNLGTLTVGDLRAARAALSPINQEVSIHAPEGERP